MVGMLVRLVNKFNVLPLPSSFIFHFSLTRIPDKHIVLIASNPLKLALEALLVSVVLPLIVTSMPQGVGAVVGAGDLSD
jgi:hypothetical protein